MPRASGWILQRDWQFDRTAHTFSPLRGCHFGVVASRAVGLVVGRGGVAVVPVRGIQGDVAHDVAGFEGVVAPNTLVIVNLAETLSII